MSLFRAVVVNYSAASKTIMDIGLSCDVNNHGFDVPYAMTRGLRNRGGGGGGRPPPIFESAGIIPPFSGK